MKKLKKVAISCHHDDYENRYKNYGPSILARDYFQYPVLKEGGVPVILPSIPYTTQILDTLVSDCDGVIVYGGYDIDPIVYGEELIAPVHRYELRDENEQGLIRYCIDNKIPVFGTCRGMQMINVILGGTLHQDIKQQYATNIQHEMNRDEHAKLAHKVKLTKKTLLKTLLGKEEIWVNSFHHQVIKELAPNLIASAKSSDDLIEAIEHDSLPLVGVQRHPEFNYHNNKQSKKIFQYVVQNLFTRK